MNRNSRLLIALPILFTLLVAWFAVSALRAAPQLATENLRGAALSISSTIEQLAAADSSLRSLTLYSNPDIAYFALLDVTGKIAFHSNQTLIGSHFPDNRNLPASEAVMESRETLGTGEIVYILKSKIYFKGDERLLVMALHTYRADKVIRRANAGIAVLASLTASLWILTLIIMYLIRRDHRRSMEMMRREELARIGEMSAVLAHEIRNPLAGIKGFAQLVKIADDLDEAGKHAEKIVRQSLRMEELVNDLLSFAREERSTRAPANVSALLLDCIQMIKIAEDTADKIIIKTEITDNCMADISVERIYQLFLNLMKNSIQAMPDGGELSIKLQKDQKFIRISIADTGVGIPPENIGKIFEPFWTDKAKGTGLGLALSKKIIEEHEGTLAVKSKVGAGSEFIIKLPQNL